MNNQISRVDFRARLRHVLYFLDAHKRPLVLSQQAQTLAKELVL